MSVPLKAGSVNRVFGTGIYLEVIQGTGMRGEIVEEAIKGCVIEVAALDYKVSSTEASEKEPEWPPDLSVQVMGSWDIYPVPHWLRVFLGVLTPLCLCALQAAVGEGLEAEKQRGEVGA